MEINKTCLLMKRFNILKDTEYLKQFKIFFAISINILTCFFMELKIV